MYLLIWPVYLVVDRTYLLLLHYRPHVRRRALLVFRSLSRHDPEVLQRITGKIIKRLTDTQPTVVGAALLVSSDLSQVSHHALLFPWNPVQTSTLDICNRPRNYPQRNQWNITDDVVK